VRVASLALIVAFTVEHVSINGTGPTVVASFLELRR